MEAIKFFDYRNVMFEIKYVHRNIFVKKRPDAIRLSTRKYVSALHHETEAIHQNTAHFRAPGSSQLWLLISWNGWSQLIKRFVNVICAF